MPVFDQSIITPSAITNKLCMPVSNVASSPYNMLSLDFMNLGFRASLQLNTTGAAYESLLKSENEFVLMTGNWNINVDGSFRVEADGHFNSTIGSAFSGLESGKASVFNVTKDTNIVFKGTATDVYQIPQTMMQDNLLKVVANGLALNQTSTHNIHVNGTKQDIIVGNIHETIKANSSSTYIVGSVFTENRRGTILSFVPITSWDVVFGLQSEFVEVLQVNMAPGVTLTTHLMLKVLQGIGGAASCISLQFSGIKSAMEAIETSLGAFRGFVANKTGRAAPVLMGIIRIFL